LVAGRSAEAYIFASENHISCIWDHYLYCRSF